MPRRTTLTSVSAGWRPAEWCNCPALTRWSGWEGGAVIVGLRYRWVCRLNQPENTTMTNTSMTLTDLIEKGGHADLLRDMIGFVCERMMELDVEGLCNAAHGER